MKAWAFSLFLFAAWIAPAHLGLPVWTGEHFTLARHEAEARRFGGGRSFGFRGSRGLFRSRGFRSRGFGSRRSFSRRSFRGRRGFRPIRRSFGRFGGMGGGLMAGLGGFFLGGMLGRMFFGGGGYGMGGGGGLGMLEILLIGGLIFFAFRFFAKRREAQHYSGPSGYASPGADTYGVGGGEYEEEDYEDSPRRGGVYRGPDISSGGGSDPGMAAGLSAIGAADPSFSREKFTDQVRANFLKFQEAWVARDLGLVRDLADSDLLAEVDRDLEALRKERRINRLEDIQLRRCEIVESWQEEGFDFITVLYDARLIDYVVSEDSGEVLEGSRSEKVAFTEYWTWARKSGGGAWTLSAISQG